MMKNDLIAFIVGGGAAAHAAISSNATQCELLMHCNAIYHCNQQFCNFALALVHLHTRNEQCSIPNRLAEYYSKIHFSSQNFTHHQICLYIHSTVFSWSF